MVTLFMLVITKGPKNRSPGLNINRKKSELCQTPMLLPSIAAVDQALLQPQNNFIEIDLKIQRPIIART